MDMSQTFEQALVALDRVSARKLMLAAVNEDDSLQFISSTVVPALENIGKGWESGKYALAQVYMSGVICEELIDEVLPPADPKRISQPNMAIVVLEDFHVLGERIVYALLRACGYELQDLGAGLHVEDVVARVKADEVKVLLVSVLMLRSALLVGTLVQRFKEENMSVKVIVGGAPFRFDESLWREVGADGMGTNGTEAIAMVAKTLEKMQ